MIQAAIIPPAHVLQIPLGPVANDPGLPKHIVDKIVAFVDREAGRDAPLSPDDEKMVRQLLNSDPNARRLADELAVLDAALAVVFAHKDWVMGQATRRLIVAYAEDGVTNAEIGFAIEEIIGEYIEGRCDPATVDSIEELMHENISVAMAIAHQTENSRGLRMLFDRQDDAENDSESPVAFRRDPLDLFSAHMKHLQRDERDPCPMPVCDHANRA